MRYARIRAQVRIVDWYEGRIRAHAARCERCTGPAPDSFVQLEACRLAASWASRVAVLKAKLEAGTG